MDLINVNSFREYYIYDSVRRKSIMLTFVPEEEQNSVSSNFEYQNLTGRVGQVASYGGTDSEVISISFTAIQGYLPAGYSDIDVYCEDLKNLTRKNSEGVAPAAQLNLGKNRYDGFVNSVSVVKSGPFDNKSRRLKAVISIQFTCRDDKSREVN